MKNAKHVVAVMVVATALCADRAAAAAPETHRPVAVRDMARQLAARLTVNLRQAIPAVRQYSAQLAFSRPCDVRPVDGKLFVAAHRWSLSPYQFRLPPPVNALC